MPQGYWPYLIMIGAMALVIRRSLRGRTLKVDRMWVLPVIFLAVGVAMIVQSPPMDVAGAAAVALAALAGGAVGWQRGKLIRITLDAETGELTSKASPAAVVLILALFVARFALRLWMLQHPGKGQSWVAATDALVVFGFAVIIVSRLEMWLRCRKLMATAA